MATKGVSDAFDVMTGTRNSIEIGTKPVVLETAFAEPFEIAKDADLGGLKLVAGEPFQVPVFDWIIDLPPVVLEITGQGEAARRAYKAGKKVTIKFDPKKHPTSLKWTLGMDGQAPRLLPAQPAAAEQLAAANPDGAN